MTKRQPVKDFYGKILGYIDTDDVTGNKTAYNVFGKNLGKYNSNDNTTRDFYGRIVSRGETLSALIMNSANEKR